MIPGNRRMFIVDETMAVNGGYTPCVIFEGEGHRYPMGGNHSTARPWVWGPTLGEAKIQARQANVEIGLTETDETEILRSVMSAGHMVRDGDEAMRIIEQDNNR